MRVTITSMSSPFEEEISEDGSCSSASTRRSKTVYVYVATIYSCNTCPRSAHSSDVGVFSVGDARSNAIGENQAAVSVSRTTLNASMLRQRRNVVCAPVMYPNLNAD